MLPEVSGKQFEHHANSVSNDLKSGVFFVHFINCTAASAFRLYLLLMLEVHYMLIFLFKLAFFASYKCQSLTISIQNSSLKI